MKAFDKVKIRLGVILLCGTKICLISHTGRGLASYALPGGNVESGESLLSCLWREMLEELGLVPEWALSGPIFLGVQDQLVTRPGASLSPRKIHVLFGLEVGHDIPDRLASIEQDDLGVGEVVWKELSDTSNLHLYPAAGQLLHELTNRGLSGIRSAMLAEMNDENYVWQ